MSNLTTLCIIPEELQMTADWSGIGWPGIRSKNASALLMNIYQYDQNYTPVPITDWNAAKEACAINVDMMFSFNELALLLSKIVPQETGLYLYSGKIPWNCKEVESGGQNQQIKLCESNLYHRYAASNAHSISQLSGFEPDPAPGSQFILAWFASQDSVAEKIIKIWDEWPHSRCQLMLPEGPTPSKQSIEFIRVGWDGAAIGVFVGESMNIDLLPSHLRQLLGEDTILASLGSEYIEKWLDGQYDFDDLKPVDRDLPFCR
ncbi:MAG: hypothetical protein ACYC27_12825 [Armatimonadota bacterium]